MKLYYILLLWLSLITCQEDNSLELKGSDFDLMTSKGTWFIKHYVPWCKHCKRLGPYWTKLSVEFANLKEEKKFYFGQINCDKEVELCKQHEIDGYPTLLLYKDGVLQEEFTGEVKDDVELRPYIKKMADKFFGDTPKEEEEESKDKVDPTTTNDKDTEVKEETNKNGDTKQDKDKTTETTDKDSKGETITEEDLTEEKLKLDDKLMERKEKEYTDIVISSTFEHITSKGYSLVKFFAPWCIHCQHFKPTWIALSSKLSSYKQLKQLQFLNFDCDAESDFCKDKGVTGYPSIKLYKDGELIKSFSGFDRSLEIVEKWLLEAIHEDETGKMNVIHQKQKIVVPIELNNVKKIKDQYGIKSSNGIWFIAFIPKVETEDIDPFGNKWEVITKEFEKFNELFNTQFAYVDCGISVELCKLHKIKKQVELKIYLNGNWVENYMQKQIDMDSLESYIRQKTSLLYNHHLFAEYHFKKDRIANPDGKIMELNKDNYNMLIKRGNFLIMFQQTTCMKCKPIFSIMQELAPSFINQVNLVTVQCDKNIELCQSLKINNYPTLKYFKDGSSRDYHGPNDKSHIESFIKHAMKPSIRIVNDQQLESLLKVEQLSFWLFIHQNEQQLEQLSTVLNAQYLDNNVYLLDSKHALKFKQLPKSYPSLIKIQNGKIISDINSFEDTTQVKQQLKSNLFDKLTKLDHRNFDIFIKQYSIVLLAFLNKNHNPIEKKVLSQVADQNKDNSVGIGYLDGTQFKEYIKRVYNKEEKDLPFFVISNPKQSIIYQIDDQQSSNKFDQQFILNNLNKVIKGELQAQSTTIDSPVSQNHLFGFVVVIILAILFYVFVFRRRNRTLDDAERRKMLNED